MMDTILNLRKPDLIESEEREDLNQHYDVFLCFYPFDSRTFTQRICDALRKKRIKTFMYGPGFDRGKGTSIYLLKALETSRIAIVVYSSMFASSTYCLDELVRILWCNKTKNQLLFPIFYGDGSKYSVTQLRHPSRMYIHEDNFGKAFKRLKKWESAVIELEKIIEEHNKSIKDTGKSLAMAYSYQNKGIEYIVERVTNYLPKYHAFISFCEKDTRYNFTGHLYETVDREGFRAFMKDKGWEDEDQTSQSVIEKSRISIIVLSQNYAYSSSCLDELVSILDFMKVKNHLVWPIFYKVDPSDIRHQRKSYGKAMAEHENKFGNDSHKVKTWRSALVEVASFKGWHLKFGYEHDLIQQIVDTMIKI